ncbi:MAG: GAF domain-containing protein, partial [Thermodesulfovibrionia bacterium]|nr:GAF domain-containing protein [Thermodesulfovibrionia bacterium]
MELLALLSNNDDFTIPEVKAALKRYTVYPLKTVEELEDLYTTIPLNLILIDTVSHRLSSLSGFLQKFNEDTAILITPEKLDRFTLDNLPPSVYDHVETQSIKTELPAIIERALEKQRFKNEIDLLRKTKKATPLQEEVRTGAHGEAISGHRGSLQYGKYLQEKILVNFAKMLTVSFDTKKLFNHFMDSVMGIVRINKMSVMLRDEEGFSVKVHIGLDPYLAEHFTLKRDSALVTWLAKTGRIMQKPDYPVDSAAINIKSEMDVLQCSFSFPLMHKGKLIGIFNIDNKITEEPFYREELEMIYMFCNYLAAAVKDINLYHQIWYQKEFTRNILSSMNSGVIAIDRDEKIT